MQLGIREIPLVSLLPTLRLLPCVYLRRDTRPRQYQLVLRHATRGGSVRRGLLAWHGEDWNGTRLILSTPEKGTLHTSTPTPDSPVIGPGQQPRPPPPECA